MAIQHGRTHQWQRSTHSGGNGACVEVRSPVPHSLAVRDSKAGAGPRLGFGLAAWAAFVDTVARDTDGSTDLLG